MRLDIKQIYYICAFYCITFLSWTHYVGLFNHYQRACYLSVQRRLDFFLRGVLQRHIFCVCLQSNTPYNYFPIRFIAIIYFTTCVASMFICCVHSCSYDLFWLQGSCNPVCRSEHIIRSASTVWIRGGGVNAHWAHTPPLLPHINDHLLIYRQEFWLKSSIFVHLIIVLVYEFKQFN